jgi:hypothetical protein
VGSPGVVSVLAGSKYVGTRVPPGRGGARDTARALRLALGGGLLLLACVLAVALAARGAGGTGESVLEQAQARALTPEQQQVRVCARAGASCVTLYLKTRHLARLAR